MNRNGFTLVELLAVIIILALLAVLATTSITKLVVDSKKELSDTQIQLIKSSAEAWSADNLSKLPDLGNCSYITLQDLKDYGLIDSNVIDPETNKEISKDLKIKISTKQTSYGKSNTTFEVNPSSIDGCVSISSSSDSDTACTIVSGDLNTVGSKISCNGQNFYVISNDGENIQMLTEYNLSLTSPYLQDSTDTAYPSTNPLAFSGTGYWASGGYSPAGNSSYNYVYDSNSNLYTVVQGYVSYLNSNGLSGATGKLLSYEQAEDLGCSESSHFCPSALTWIRSSSYWLGSSYDTYRVWYVDSAGYFSSGNCLGDIYFGVRPVITILKDEIK